jgi:DNA-binding transcriptional ArsR family regulator
MDGIELDARTLRAIAHPLRMRMLGLLRREGPATASSLAAALGESSGTTSWHLRQLAEHGFIVEDSELGNRRERWWRAAHRYTQIKAEKFLDDPETADALGTLMHEVANTYHRELTVFIDEAGTWSREWIKAADYSDEELPLTPDELLQLRTDLHEVLKRYRRPRKDGDESVRVQLQLFPRRRP